MDETYNMSERYWKFSTLQLRRLKSMKENKIMRLASKPLGYFDQQEIRKLKGHLRWINAVLAARDDQMAFPE